MSYHNNETIANTSTIAPMIADMIGAVPVDVTRSFCSRLCSATKRRHGATSFTTCELEANMNARPLQATSLPDACSVEREAEPTFGHRNTTSEFADFDRRPTCRVVRAGVEFVGKQGHLLAPGISAHSAGARRIHLQIATIPPGMMAKAHKHADHETAINVLGGISGLWYGENLEQHVIVRAGDFLYIPADMPHLPYNLSGSESCVAVIARADPAEQESVILLPELDGLHEPLPGPTSL